MLLTTLCQAAEDYQQKIKDSEDTKVSASSTRLSGSSNSNKGGTESSYQQNKRGVNDYELNLQGEMRDVTCYLELFVS